MGSKKIKSGLTAKQELFCQNFVSAEFFGNGVQSYINAFKVDLKKPNAYNVAKTEASKLLTNPNLLTRINELLDTAGFNDSHVDKQLLLVITQNADFSSKVAGIREYNKLRGRITDKINVEQKVTGFAIEITKAKK
jgi:hypothetical protein